MHKNIWAFVNSHAVRSFFDDQPSQQQLLVLVSCRSACCVKILGSHNLPRCQFQQKQWLPTVKQGGVCLFLLHWINKQGGNPFVFEKTHAGQLSCCWATMGVGLQLTNCSQQGVKRSQFYLMFQSKMSYIFNPKHFYYCIKDVQKSKILAKRVIIMHHYRILRILRSSKTFVGLISHPDHTKHKSYLKCKLYKANQSMKVSLIRYIWIFGYEKQTVIQSKFQF